ncbi:unnamed protein product [Protopolystoma xenopodis]|uniref:Tyrosine-protein phosphatase domain-containing protein n=1 Tax=Protopolystoma xenopodis TaxID=117903 RepID=A0A3S5AM43_9PLAT|nr:unnamed protein product [Protopolystoma xenopodis]
MLDAAPPSAVTFKKKWNDEVQKVTHLHFTDWPDQDVPTVEDFDPFFDIYCDFDVRMEKDQKLGPNIIHCRYGS